MTEELSFGLELMFVGMGIVFLFLAMLVLAINIMSALVRRFFPKRPCQRPQYCPLALTRALLRLLLLQFINTETSISK